MRAARVEGAHWFVLRYPGVQVGNLPSWTVAPDRGWETEAGTTAAGGGGPAKPAVAR